MQVDSANGPEASLDNDHFKCPTCTKRFFPRARIEKRRATAAVSEPRGVFCVCSMVIEKFEKLCQGPAIRFPGPGPGFQHKLPSLFGEKVNYSPVQLPGLRTADLLAAKKLWYVPRCPQWR